MRCDTTTSADESEIASLFDKESAAYDAAYDAAHGHVLRARFNAVVEALGPGPGEVLDGGMGPGRLCAELDRGGWRVSGVDLSASMVEMARLRIPHARDRLVQGSIEAVPFGDASFDAATAMGVLEYVDDVEAALRELARVIRPGGSLVVTIPHPLSVEVLWRRHLWYPAMRAVKRAVPGFSRSAPYRKPPTITERRLAHAVRAAGLHPSSSRHVSYAPLPIAFGGRVRRSGLRLAERLELTRPAVARPFANQVVMLARKHHHSAIGADGLSDARPSG